MTSNAAVLTPVFVQVGLTFALMYMMAGARVAAGKSGQVKIRDIALGQTAPWPERPAKFARAFHNQLETPLLFYAVVAFALASAKVDAAFVALEWLYVAARLAHAYVHVTSNHVPTRFRIFALSTFLLGALWAWFAIRTLATG